MVHLQRGEEREFFFAKVCCVLRSLATVFSWFQRLPLDANLSGSEQFGDSLG